MKHFAYSLMVLLFLFLTSCTNNSKLYHFGNVTPDHIAVSHVRQESLGYPPLLKPTSKRVTIKPRSQYFILAIPNCVDMTGRAQDLRKSLADMLYTKLFQTGRFNLYDRNALVNLDTDWLEQSLKQSAMNANTTKTDITSEKGGVETDNAQTISKNVASATMEVWQLKKVEEQKSADELKKAADGLLLVYITSRTEDGKGGGYFTVDYRIVNSVEDQDAKDTAASNQISDKNKNTVLFAGSQVVRFKLSNAKSVEYERGDIQEISDNIFKVFPNPESSRKGQVISINGRRMVADLGKEDHLIPGLRGYIVSRDDSIYTTDLVQAQHYEYLAEFQVMEVYSKTCTIEVLTRENHAPDVKVGDEIVLK